MSDGAETIRGLGHERQRKLIFKKHFVGDLFAMLKGFASLAPG